MTTPSGGRPLAFNKAHPTTPSDRGRSILPRLVRAGFGGEMQMTDRGELEPHYYLLAADLTVFSDESYRGEQSLAANWTAWTRMYGDPVFRYPWRSKAQFRQFRQEMTSAARSASLSRAARLLLRAKWTRWSLG